MHFAAFIFSPVIALFGVGDIVFDPQNFSQTVKIVAQYEQQLQKLATIIGIETGQLETVTAVQKAIGNASDFANFPRNPSSNDVLGFMRKVPGLEGAGLGDVGKLFNSAGVLDLFMGTSVQDWKRMVQDPSDYFGNTLMNRATERIGGELGMNQSEIGFSKWVGQMDDSQRRSNRSNIASAAADYMLERWYKSAKDREAARQEQAARNAAIKETADKASTQNEMLAAQSALMNETNNILLKSAAESSQARDNIITQAQRDNERSTLEQDRESLRRAMERVKNQ